MISQTLGYTCSKFLGTRLCSGLHRENVFRSLMLCIGTAMLSLLLMALLPVNYAFACLFLNGLSLGMVWGMVMRPLEGRNASEFLMAGLCCSFIVASGDVKSYGKDLLSSEWFVQTFKGNDMWMPFILGALFLLPFTIAAFFLTKIPKPSEADIASRGDRKSMSKADCIAFMKSCAQVLIPLAIVYFLLTAYRDYRDNFQADLLAQLGENESDIFSKVERIVAYVVVSITALLILFRKHINALRASMSIMTLGLILCVIATVLRQNGSMSPSAWMISTGIGAYLCYIPFNCILFERMVALTKSPGNAVFAIMLFDGIGYLGSIGLTAVSGSLQNIDRLAFFDRYTWVLGVVGSAALVWSILGLKNVKTTAPSQNEIPAGEPTPAN